MTLSWRGELAYEIARKAAMQALIDGAQNILAESIDEAPIDTGDLRKSARVDVDEAVGEVYISYGNDGLAADYAVIQHEDLTFQHAVGKAKFLEDPYNRNKDKILQNAENAVHRALGNAR